MRTRVISFALLALAACSRAPDSGDATPEIGGNAAANIAFQYSYGFRLPARAIADVQESHAQACERLGAARCRITGLGYDVDDSGDVSASLTMQVAAPVARRFGREGVLAVEQAGGALSGARVSADDAAAVARAADDAGAAAGEDRQRIDRALADRRTPAADRAELLRRRAELESGARASAADASAQRARIAASPVHYSYESGRGVGVVAQLQDTGDLALASLARTLTAVLWLLAVAGPPLLLLALLVVLWHRRGRRAWRRLLGSDPPLTP